jgi:hypothetical protein
MGEKMAEEILSLLSRASLNCAEVAALIYNMRCVCRPHAVYTDPGTGVATVALVNVDLDDFRDVPLSQITEVTFTDRSFDPDPRFDPSDQRYSNSFAKIRRTLDRSDSVWENDSAIRRYECVPSFSWRLVTNKNFRSRETPAIR